MSNVENLHQSNKVLEKLDARITKAIMGVVKEHKITTAEIAGVMRVIEFRMFVEGLSDDV